MTVPRTVQYVFFLAMLPSKASVHTYYSNLCALLIFGGSMIHDVLVVRA